jgi:PadR family transcriptional regulator, regulatory protein PadR
LGSVPGSSRNRRPRIAAPNPGASSSQAPARHYGSDGTKFKYRGFSTIQVYVNRGLIYCREPQDSASARFAAHSPTFPLTFYKNDVILRRPLVEQLGGAIVTQSPDILQGTLDLLILKTLALEPMHGWGIAQRIQQVSKEVLQVQQGSLYPALYRLERKRLIEAQWGASENNRRAKFYSLTKAGRDQLEKEQADWERLSSAVALILQRV